MHFATAISNESRKTHTENGATAYNTTGSHLLDLFGSIGSLREATPNRIERLFEEAFYENPLYATKCLFYGRDVRGGLGERHTFRVILKYAAQRFPEAVSKNIPLIGLYGRYDDLYSLVGTQLEGEMWDYVGRQLKSDEAAMEKGKPCSLLAKWLKTPDASSKTTRTLGILTAKKLNMSVYVFKRKLRALRKYLKIVETQMSANHWNEVDYATVPSRAMMIYRKAFGKHDQARFNQYLLKVEKGEAKINAAALFPYDLVMKYTEHGWWNLKHLREDPVIEAQWKSLPNYCEGEANALVIADTSGSMTSDNGRPMASALGLALYFANRNKGAYHGLWMSFSESSAIQRIRGNSLAHQLGAMNMDGWGCNTNLEAAFMKVLQIALDNDVSEEEMVKSLIVISDMQIDACVSKKWSFYDEMRSRYAAAGYAIPNVIFWNVNSRDDVFHADKSRKGVQVCSGQSASTFKHLMKAVNMTAEEMMYSVLDSDRYAPIEIG